MLTLLVSFFEKQTPVLCYLSTLRGPEQKEEGFDCMRQLQGILNMQVFLVIDCQSDVLSSATAKCIKACLALW